MESESSANASSPTHNQTQRGPSGDVPKLNDIKGDIRALEATLDLVKNIDMLSIASLQSHSFADGRNTIMSIDTSLDRLDELEASARRLRNEICSRRMQIVVATPADSLNTPKSVPILRLPSEILCRIIDIVASLYQTSPSELGWIKTSHVCSAWRQAIISCSFLWAREVGAFHSPHSLRTILRRARGAPLTVTNLPPLLSDSRGCPDQPLNDVYLELLPQVRYLDLILTSGDIVSVVRALSKRSLPMLEQINLELADLSRPLVLVQELRDLVTSIGSIMCPNLRDMSFVDFAFIPFSSEHLVKLSIRGYDNDGLVPILGPQFLDFLLASASTLETLHLDSWLPSVWDEPEDRRVLLPALRHMVMISPVATVTYTKFCKWIETPALVSLSLEHIPPMAELNTASEVLEILELILSAGSGGPCVASSRSLAITLQGTNLCVYTDGPKFDPDRIADISSAEFRVSYGRTRLHCTDPSGIELLFWMRDPVDIGDLFHAVAARYAIWRTRANLRPLETISFQSKDLLSISARNMFEGLDAIETLHLYLTQEVRERWGTIGPGEDEDHSEGILHVLASPKADGSFLLPRLRSIPYEHSALSVEQRDRMQKQLDRLAKARGSHGMTVSIDDRTAD
ncbi:unnamed protein product [Peniophora sp. CBMAI 1063]|nr:unnamed protein product [Peniophora sp. CBMAI 1063]